MFLAQEVEILRATIIQLESANKKLELAVKELSSTNEFLRKRVTELEDKLNIDSSNSGLPTSKEIYKKESKSRPKSSRKAGGQPNHKYNGYKRRTPDKIIDIVPQESECKCGSVLELAEEYTVHQKIEIPEIKPYVSEYRLRKKISPALHIDETGHKNKGKRHWCWVLANEAVTIFKLASSRGRKVLESFLPSYAGKVISDRYAVYNLFAPQKRQICLAHLRRDFKRFAHSRNEMLSRFGYNLLANLDLVFAVYNGYKANKISKAYCFRKIRKLRKRIFLYLNKVRYFSQSQQAHRVAVNIQKSFDMMWLFTTDLGIPPTNNFAERQIKHHVKYRKNSLFTWSDRGDRFLERIKTIYVTAKSRKANPFLWLRTIIQDSS